MKDSTPLKFGLMLDTLLLELELPSSFELLESISALILGVSHRDLLSRQR